MKLDQVSGITVLLVDLDVHACSLGTLPKFGEVPKPFTRAPSERNVRRRRVKKVQLCLADNRETECTFECSFTGLLEIDCAQDSSDGIHVVSLLMRSMPSDGESEYERRVPSFTTGPSYSLARRSSCALIATMTVLADIRTAAKAGGRRMPCGARTPAASGIATML